jgi:hypothetical protein
MVNKNRRHNSIAEILFIAHVRINEWHCEKWRQRIPFRPASNLAQKATLQADICFGTQHLQTAVERIVKTRKTNSGLRDVKVTQKNQE